jgi:L-Ala-D/L-Glu epimerase
MIIKSIHVSLLTAPLLQPFRIATGQHDELKNVLFEIRLKDGTSGFGEAAVATHITGETIPDTVRNLKTVGQYLCGQSIGNYLALGHYVHSLLKNNMSATAAVEAGLHDALCKHLNIPLWKLWGTTPKPFATDITIVIATLDETIAKTKNFYTSGFRAFKIKVGKDMDLDFKRVVAVSKIARKSTIILDANQGFSAEETLRFLKMIKDARVNVSLIEQPVPKMDWDGLMKVTRSTKVLVCADESASSLDQAVKIIKHKAAGAINIKLMKTGLNDSIAIAQLARANGVKLMIGGMMESSLAMTTSAHMATGLGCFDFIDLDTPFFIKGDATKNPYLSSRGVYDLRKSKPGIGITP